MDKVYPAIFAANDDGSYTITYPDLPGCISEGKNLAEAMRMAQSALNQWLGYLADKGEPLPKATHLKALQPGDNEVATLVCADSRTDRAVKRTVSLPSGLDKMAADAGLSLSRVLQDALQQRLQ